MAQPEDALGTAAQAGDLAACTRLLGAGTHPVGYKVSEPECLPPAATAPLSSFAGALIGPGERVVPAG